MEASLEAGMSEVGFIMMLIPNWRSAMPATQRPAALRPLTRELDDATANTDKTAFPGTRRHDC